MHIISRKRLVLFALTHADSEAALDTWYRTAKSAQWQNLVELREAYPSVDLVDIYTVFNIKGNHYRLIAEINYRSETIFVSQPGGICLDPSTELQLSIRRLALQLFWGK